MTLARDAFNSRFWRAAKRRGMLDAMTLLDETPTRDIDVDFIMPNEERFNRQMGSRDFRIEYQYTDAPDLREGARVQIGGASYKLRSDPFVPSLLSIGEVNDGFYRQALLSPVAIATNVLLLESGDALLLESGDHLLLEAA